MTPEEYATELAAEDDLDLRETLRNLRSSRFLRRVVFRSCKLLERSHTGAEASHDFIEGQRSIGTWLLDELFRVDPQMAAQWWAEYAEERIDRQVSTQTHAVRERSDGDTP